jgi:hypothetical protein
MGDRHDARSTRCAIDTDARSINGRTSSGEEVLEKVRQLVRVAHRVERRDALTVHLDRDGLHAVRHANQKTRQPIQPQSAILSAGGKPYFLAIPSKKRLIFGRPWIGLRAATRLPPPSL